MKNEKYEAGRLVVLSIALGFMIGLSVGVVLTVVSFSFLSGINNG